MITSRIALSELLRVLVISNGPNGRVYSSLKEYTPCAASVIIFGTRPAPVRRPERDTGWHAGTGQTYGTLANARLVQPVSNASRKDTLTGLC
jgi:hypothetical protein